MPRLRLIFEVKMVELPDVEAEKAPPMTISAIEVDEFWLHCEMVPSWMPPGLYICRSEVCFDDGVADPTPSRQMVLKYR